MTKPFSILSLNINGVATKKSSTKLYDPMSTNPSTSTTVNNNLSNYASLHDISIITLQELKIHSSSMVKTTKEAYDPYSKHPYIYFDNTNHLPSPKSGTSIIILQPDVIKNPTNIYNDSADPNHWNHPSDPTLSTGRIQIISLEFENVKYYLANIYAPSESNKIVKLSFFSFLSSLFSRPELSNITNENLILVGDWNIVENPTTDTFSLTNDTSETTHRDQRGGSNG